MHCTLGSTQQIVDQHLGMNLLLDVQRRRMHHQFAPVLLVFPAPDELRVEIAVARFLFLVQADDIP
jgi:hypothetical protein